MLFRYFHSVARPGVFLAFALLLAGCGGSAAPPDARPAATAEPATTAAAATTVVPTTAAPTTTAPPATTVAEQSPEDLEAEIIEAYLAGWEVFFQMAADPAADPAFISEARTGRSLERALEVRSELLEDGFVGAFPDNSVYRHQPQLVGITDDGSAVVTDCMIDDSFKLNIATGDVDNAGVDSLLWATTLVETPDGWLMEFNDLQRSWVREEVPDCDA